jgi:hypothetical protein
MVGVSLGLEAEFVDERLGGEGMDAPLREILQGAANSAYMRLFILLRQSGFCSSATREIHGFFATTLPFSHT